MTRAKEKEKFSRKLALMPKNSHNLKLDNGSSVAVIGGGPAGSFFSLFLLDLAKRVDLDVSIDIYDRKDFSRCGPAGCNRCGGIVSESLVQRLATESINIPSNVMQKGIKSYVLHTDAGNVRIETSLQEKRIAAIYRGAGPLGTEDGKCGSFDKYLQDLAVKKGARHIKDRVESICFDTNLPLVKTRKGLSKTYNLLVGAVGVNPSTPKLFKGLNFGYHPPGTTKTFICEFLLGRKMIQKYFGNSMHIFLLNIPRLEFAALIPKGDNVTMVLLGKDIDKELVESLLNTPEVKRCFPPEYDLKKSYPCSCFPEINIKSALKPFSDRVVLIGDCATTKLYKNGIDAAHSTAKAAATTAIFEGISNEDFRQHYWPTCQAIIKDNKIGVLIFTFTRLIQKIRLARQGILRMTSREQQNKNGHQRMSMVLWDIFTGSGNYMDIVFRILHPFFLVRLLWETTIGFLPFDRAGYKEEKDLKTNSLGRLYKDGEAIVNQGERGDCMYVVQSGRVKVVRLMNGREVKISELSEGDCFGEMALFDHNVRSATVCSIGESRILTVDKKNFLRWIQKDPSMAFQIMQTANDRVRKLTDQVSRMKASDRRDWKSRPDKK
ncbi:MAG: cyclic nucleotide-binding domain-containing protein [Candidatus Brocadiaceae bacterium]|nr:cyclic nucleotide-binding domain-containing protein [Candidatus Brocadiaceae bacterium]